MLPWTFKLIYGIIADNIPIYGSRRRSYVILSGLLQFATLMMLCLRVADDEITITAMLFISSLSTAFTDVVIDACMVAQSRKDPKHGSEDLQSYSWTLLSIGGILGSLLAAFFTEFLKPRHTFFLCSLFGLAIAYAGWHISPNVEEDNEETLGFVEQFK